MKPLIIIILLWLTTACGFSAPTAVPAKSDNAKTTANQIAVSSQSPKTPSADEAGIKSRIKALGSKKVKQTVNAEAVCKFN